MTNHYRICTNCVMDTTDPDIQFDENGVCNHCRTYPAVARATSVPFAEGGEQIVNALVKEIKDKGKNRAYDCIIGVSGGVDSTFVAYKVKELGLRPLAVHLDNGWNSELAVNNIEKTLKVLKIDLYTHVIDWEEFKQIQLAFLRASTTEGELPTDHAILAVLYRAAMEHGLEYIIVGGNHSSEGILPVSWAYGSKDWRYTKNIIKKFGGVKIKTWPHFSLADYFYYVFIKGIKSIRILEYLSYNKNEAMKILEKELCWKYYGGKHYESVYTRFYQGYVLPWKFNIDKRKCHLSSLICAGQMTRQEALEKLKEDTYPPQLQQQDREYVAKKLGITEGEFENIMSIPVKSFSDYPNNYGIFKLLFAMLKYVRKAGMKIRSH